MKKEIILITGASTGIGYASAIYLQSRNFNVVATVRNEKDKIELEKYNIEVHILDVTDTEKQKELFQTISSKYTINTVFFNAGFGQVGAVEDITKESLYEQFDTNVFAVWDGIHNVMPIFRKQKFGKIIINSSVVGYAPLAFRGAYCSTKFALEGLSDTLRQELLGTNIYSILLCPGPIESNFRKTALIKFMQNINYKNSYFANDYESQIQRLSSLNSKSKYSLESIDCAKLVEKIILTKKPRARYMITFPAKLFYYLKKFLPSSVIDKMLAKVANLHYFEKK